MTVRHFPDLQAMFAILLLLLLLSSFYAHSVDDESFDVRQHLSTVSRFILLSFFIEVYFSISCS